MRPWVWPWTRERSGKSAGHVVLRGLGTIVFALGILASSIAEAESKLPVEGLRPWQHEIMIDAIELYRPLAKEKNFRLRVNVVNHEFLAASAENLGGGDLRVNVGRGLLESPRLTPDVYRLILCHEIGHLLGGEPRLPLPAEWDGARSSDGGSLLSSEGQSDYYSTATCFRRLAKTGFAAQSKSLPTELHNVRRAPAPARIQELCAKAWPESEVERSICERAALAGVGFLTLVSSFNISLEVRDTTEATKVIVNTYPSRQCRLDTMVAGALCSVDLPLDFSRVQDLDLRCAKEEAQRPKCWYRP